jgi:hypothetical protein
MNRNARPRWGGNAGDTYQPVELEICNVEGGVLRTIYRWYRVSHFHAGADRLSFDFDPAITVEPSALDWEIIRRAAAMLSSDAVSHFEFGRSRLRLSSTSYPLTLGSIRSSTIAP